MSRRSTIALDLLALALVAVAFLHGRGVTADLEWPGDPDMFRDLSVAESLRTCRCLDDPHYRGELLWYNPLTSGVVALVSAATGRPTHLVQVRDGAYLNLLGPIGVYVLAVTIGGRLVALPALASFLFLGPGQLFDTSSYSPWLMSPNFAQGVLYLALAAYLRASERPGRWWWVTAGVLSGLTVLGHTAAALLLFTLAGVDTLASLLSAPAGARATIMTNRAVMAGTATMVASPFLYAVVWHYGGRVLNAVPTLWIDRSMELERWASFVTAHLLRPHMALVAVGLAAAAVGVPGRLHRRVLLTWIAACVAVVAYGYAWQWQVARGVTWPRVVPEFHFLRLLDAAEHLAFGLGVAFLGARVTARLSTAGVREALAVTAVALAALGAAVAVWPRYQGRHDFTAMRTSSLGMYRDPEQLALREWVRTESAPAAVFLADPNVAFSIIAPAGRRVLEVPAFFSNTFVSWSERHSAASAMWGALTASNCEGLRELSDRYGITHAIDERSARWTRSVQNACGWTPVWTTERWAVFARPAG